MNEPLIFYDGTCGLCHFIVCFVLKRMGKSPFYFAPLNGSTFQSLTLSNPPDSLVVFVPETKQVLFKGRAVIYLFSRLGNPWKALSRFLECFPIKFIDGLYTRVAKLRRKLLKQPEKSCPNVPKKFQKFFKN
ncbi:MAG: DUF393 domain-containing protein [Simkania sp.]|nr:DUF393 domain-containing protein [Simkania sp.]